MRRMKYNNNNNTKKTNKNYPTTANDFVSVSILQVNHKNVFIAYMFSWYRYTRARALLPICKFKQAIEISENK